MENSIILNLILLLLYSASVIAEGCMDGYNKKHNKMLHGLKLMSHGGLLVILFISLISINLNYYISPYILISFILTRKPLLDYSWSITYTGKRILVIGTTSLTDKMLRWTKLDVLEKKTGIPVIGFIYLALVFSSIVLAIDLGK